MKPNFPVSLLAAFAALTPAFSQEEPEPRPVDALLETLGDPDMDVRVEALRELQTSLDPRLPEALLPLLGDEGNTIRRLAARGVGSRWWQIPEARLKVFTKALATNAESGFDDEKHMALRGLGLLRRDYDGEMFARSANRRWVVYERRNLPCLIDTTTGTEELLGWEGGRAWLGSSWGNGTLEGAVRWHAEEELCVFSMLLSRKASTVWVWRHGKGLREFGIGELLRVLGRKEADILSGAGFYADFKAWTGDGFSIDVSYTTEKGDALVDHTAELEWNPDTAAWRVVSQEAADQ